MERTMADRPILFSGAMVRALLAGRKTQTRRVLRRVPNNPVRINGIWHDDHCDRQLGAETEFKPMALSFAVGDRLWVREAWRVTGNRDAIAPRDLPPRTLTTFFEAGGSMGGVEPMPKDRERSAAEYIPDAYYPPFGTRPEWVGRLRQGMHMPRWASRLTLTVTDVRVQRLQEISEADAIAEGIVSCTLGGIREGLDEPGDWAELPDETPMYFASDGEEWVVHADPREAYGSLWEDINADRGFGWYANPWVVAVSFTVAQRNIDAVAP